MRVVDLSENELMSREHGLAAVIVCCLLVAMASASVPAQAHFTLGELRPTSRFRASDFDPHLPGPLGYVWPGGGLSSLTGNAAGLPPGYQTPWPDAKPVGAQRSWYQLESSAYSPFGALLASTDDHLNVGDLVFAINFSRPRDVSDLPPLIQFSALYVYIPPEFGGIVKSQVVTTMTNDYSQISVGKAGLDDPFAPGWTRVAITSATSGVVMEFRASRDTNQDGIGYDEWYYIRLNGVTAPSIAGKYFFKMLLKTTGENVWRYPADLTPPTANNMFMPVQNWPTLLVKAEIDPGIIWGTIRHGSWNETLYNLPIMLPGRVTAVGFADDPYTGEPTSRRVEGRAYFNASARGHYELEGLAAGTYDLYASAAGYPRQPIASGVRIRPGQSLQLDGHINPGPVVTGQVFSKHGYGEEPWAGLRPLMVEIYDSHDYVEESRITYSPSNFTGSVWGIWNVNGSRMSHSWTPGSTPTPRRVALDWRGPLSYYADGTMFASSGPLCGGRPDPCGVPNGVGPAQFWWVDPDGLYTNGGGPSGFIFRFGSRGVYGAPTNMSGYVPQGLATWVDGLRPGRYYVRVFVNGYVQTAIDGKVFEDNFFDVAPEDWAGQISIPIDIRRSSSVEKTVWFHDREGTLVASPTRSPGTLVAELYDQDSRLVGMNFSFVPQGSTSGTVTINGLGMHGWHPLRKFSSYGYLGFGYQDYGLPAGTYKLKTYFQGYIQKELDTVSLVLSGSPAIMGDHMHRGASLNLTLFSIDWQRPTVERPWLWPGERILVEIFDPTGDLLDFRVSFQVLGSSTVGPVFMDGNYGYVGFPGAEPAAVSGLRPISYEAGIYTIKARTYGYVQKQDLALFAAEGNLTSDGRLNLLIGVNFSLSVKFEAEGAFSHVPFNMSVRIRVYNDLGDLVAAWITGSAYDVIGGTQLNSGLYPDPGNPRAMLSLSPTTRPSSMVWWLPASTTDLQLTLAGIPVGYFDPVLGLVDSGGIDGYPDYQGGWTIEVDAVNWYLPSVSYPPAPALLHGESFHIVSGHRAGLFLWTGDHLAANHLGPLAQDTEWTAPPTKLGQEVSVSHHLSLRGYLSGRIFAFTWSNELRPASWVRVSIVGPDAVEFVVYSLDGLYEIYVPPGPYRTTVAEWSPWNEGHTGIFDYPAFVSDAQQVSGFDFYLNQSGLPIDEFAGVTIVMLAASLAALVRRRNGSR